MMLKKISIKITFFLMGLIVASTKYLDDAVNEGILIPDLRYRLTGFEIELKPLRERFDIIDKLIILFFERDGIEWTREQVIDIANESRKYSWPGNIRELYRKLNVATVRAMIDDVSIASVLLSDSRTKLFNSKACSSEVCAEVAFPIIYADEESKFFIELVNKAVKELKVKDRKLNITNIAELLGISRSGMKTKLEKALSLISESDELRKILD